MDRARVDKFATVWDRLVEEYPCMKVLNVDGIADESESYDFRHFKVPVLQRLGAEVANWFRSDEGGLTKVA